MLGLHNRAVARGRGSGGDEGEGAAHEGGEFGVDGEGAEGGGGEAGGGERDGEGAGGVRLWISMWEEGEGEAYSE